MELKPASRILLAVWASIALLGSVIPTASVFALDLDFNLGLGKKDQRPNVILILTDDQGYGDIGVHGNEVIKTPRLDAFARESIEMSRFYANPLCSPTRASIMTGRYHLRTGILHTSRGAAKMFGNEITLAELFAQGGYRTGIFGKWHLGDNYPMRPQDQGFQETLVHRSGGIGQTPDADATYFEPTLFKNGQQLNTIGYCTDLFFDAAIDFIEDNRKKPFFLYLPTNVPHDPLEVSKRYSDAYEAQGVDPAIAKLYGMMTNLDENFGKLVDTLDNLGLREKTLVIFMSDNGPTKGRYNAGLRGNKGSVYEGGIRVPFFVRWPAKLKGGWSSDRIAAHIDLLPTLMDVADLPLPSGVTLDGTSLLPLWNGSVPPQDWPSRSLYFQHIKSIVQAPYQNATVFNQRYKLIAYPASANDANFQPDRNQLEVSLYDLENDAFESEDLIEKLPVIASELQERYEKWFEEMRSERGFQPGVIHIGADQENPSLLCRYQDGHRPFGTDPHPIGWPVRILNGGLYRITVKNKEAREGELIVKWQNNTFTLNLSPGQRSVELQLGAGEGMLDIWTRHPGEPAIDRESDIVLASTSEPEKRPNLFKRVLDKF